MVEDDYFGWGLKGLKMLRSKNGPQNPNQYWKRTPRVRCSVCGMKIRGTNHNQKH